MHSNVLDLEKYVTEMERFRHGGDPVGKRAGDEIHSMAEDHGHFNWNSFIDDETSISDDAEKEWELICGEERNEWELV